MENDAEPCNGDGVHYNAEHQGTDALKIAVAVHMFVSAKEAKLHHAAAKSKPPFWANLFRPQPEGEEPKGFCCVWWFQKR